MDSGRKWPQTLLRRHSPGTDHWILHKCSKESWERFRDEVLMPRLQQGVQGGFAVPPQEQAFEVYNQQP